MQRQYKAKSNGHLRSWLAVMCLAPTGMLLAAQQPAATPGAVRTMLNQSAPAKPAAAPVSAPPSSSASAAPAAPKQVQNTKPAVPASSATASPSAAKPAAGAAQASAPALATSSAAAKPASTPAPTGKPGSSTTAGSHAAAVKPAATVAAKPVPPGSKLTTVSTPAPSAKPVTAAKADVPTPAATPTVTQVAAHENIARRDPFEPLLGKDKGGDAGPMNLPAGKPGLQISSLRIDGIVNGPNGMIAIVTNPQERVYFLREGDRLYDGQVQHITMDGISFHQSGKDPFGNSVEREVAKRLNSIPGEQR
jgi:hypothetical protein